MNTVVSTLAQWNTLGSGITELTVPSNSMNDASLTVLDLTRFKRLKRIVIGDECFMYVNEVRMIGLNELESVEIGMNSFTKYKNSWQITSDPNRHFYVNGCPKLKSLKMGRFSFSDYSVCEIENVNALEVIDMNDDSFYYASLELKSFLIHRE